MQLVFPNGYLRAERLSCREKVDPQVEKNDRAARELAGRAEHELARLAGDRTGLVVEAGALKGADGAPKRVVTVAGSRFKDAETTFRIGKQLGQVLQTIPDWQVVEASDRVRCETFLESRKRQYNSHTAWVAALPDALLASERMASAGTLVGFEMPTADEHRAIASATGETDVDLLWVSCCLDSPKPGPVEASTPPAHVSGPAQSSPHREVSDTPSPPPGRGSSRGAWQDTESKGGRSACLWA